MYSMGCEGAADCKSGKLLAVSATTTRPNVFAACFVLLGACTTVDVTDPTVYTGKCDDEPSAPAALSCWIDADAATADACTAWDTEFCQAQSDRVYGVSAVNVFTVNNNVEDVLFDPAHNGTPVQVLRCYRQPA